MALKSLTLNSAGNLTSHSSGVTPFDGTPANYHQWEFKTLMKSCQIQDPGEEGQGTTYDVSAKNAKILESVVSGLTHDALQLAMDIGVQRLTAVDGLKHLVDEMKKHVFPTRKLEAKGTTRTEFYHVNEPRACFLTLTVGNTGGPC